MDFRVSLLNLLIPVTKPCTIPSESISNIKNVYNANCFTACNKNSHLFIFSLYFDRMRPVSDENTKRLLLKHMQTDSMLKCDAL
jgi:hypothetical protein